MAITNPIIPLNELLQIDATVIAGLLVLLLVTKFFDRRIHIDDDSFTIPRKLVGSVIPFFAISAMTILTVDIFNLPVTLAVLISETLAFGGFLVLMSAMIIIARIPNKPPQPLDSK